MTKTIHEVRLTNEDVDERSLRDSRSDTTVSPFKRIIFEYICHCYYCDYCHYYCFWYFYYCYFPYYYHLYSATSITFPRPALQPNPIPALHPPLRGTRLWGDGPQVPSPQVLKFLSPRAQEPMSPTTQNEINETTSR